MNESLTLEGPWSFKQTGPAPRKITRWLPATVPGTVHTDLLANRIIGDPFYRMNELDQRWIEQADWVYRTRFEVPREFADAREVWLDFDGLDTLATIRLNGRRIGSTDNMFTPWRFEVKRLLRSRGNTLEVEFAAATRGGEARAAASKIKYNTAYYEHRMHLRKAQYAGGWDWGPRFMTCGIWRPVRLLAVREVEIRNVQPVTRELTDRQALVAVAVEVDSHVNVPATVRIELVSRTSGQVVRKQVKTRLARGRRTIRASVRVSQPERWWPNGMGEPHLYDLRTTVEIDGRDADRQSIPIGLRTIELVREKDQQGESFRFRVNRQDVFCKGANWIPGDSFLPRLTLRHYQDRLTAARDAHMNMIRVWGGGIYESPEFYRLCDELGLMVWQDFMFACAEYPDDRAMLATVRREAEHVVRSLRHHPSLAIWCGNNENEWLYERRWPSSPRFRGRRIFHELLPALCHQLDPDRPYWPGSPWGGPKVNDPNIGNQHIWTVWAWWEKPHTYRDWPARFVTEFGFQAMPDARTVRSFTAPADRKLFSEVLDHHNKMDEGHPRLMKYLAASLGAPRDLDDYIYLTQVLQADIIKIGVEHWRRRYPLSAGALFWQLSDCWPVTSWSAIDYFGRPKALYHASRRFFAPALVSLRPVSDKPYGPADLEVWVTHDGPSSPPVIIEATAWCLDGRRLKRRIIETRLPANGSRRVAVLEYRSLGLSCPHAELVQVRMRRGRHILSQNLHCFAPDKHLEWAPPRIHPKIVPAMGGMKIELATDRPTRAVCLAADRWEGSFSENFFDLMPNYRHTCVWGPAGKLPGLNTFRRGLTIRTIAGRVS